MMAIDKKTYGNFVPFSNKIMYITDLYTYEHIDTRSTSNIL